MDKLVIEGRKTLNGEVFISGSKNAALPILAASLLTDEMCILSNVPRLRDTMTMVKLLKILGKNVEMDKDIIKISSNGKPSHVAPYELVSTMRGSFCVLGPLLGKLKIAQVSLPGGCIIGVRPVDLHLKGIKMLGAHLEIENGYVVAKAKELKGCHMYLGGGFGSSVLATANVMMAAVLAKGETVIECAACEPEIEDLASLLITMGAKIEGKGSPRLTIHGVERLRGFNYRIIPDRIEAGTYLLLAAATRSAFTIKGANINHLMAVVDKLEEAGAKVIHENGKISVKVKGTIKPVSVTTHPYPGFPTDLQAQWMAFMAMVEGVSIITEKIYPDRFMHIAELSRMGANISREGVNAIIQGGKELFGAPVMASDLRASAALVIAGIAAKGRTEIHRMYHLDRGYEDLDNKLKAIGAKAHREKE